jgi:hypothetical protein
MLFSFLLIKTMTVLSSLDHYVEAFIEYNEPQESCSPDGAVQRKRTFLEDGFKCKLWAGP